jgi:hypothetical protein
MAVKIVDLGKDIAAGGAAQAKAFDQLAKMAIDNGQDPKLVALALDYARNGRGKPVPPGLKHLMAMKNE